MKHRIKNIIRSILLFLVTSAGMLAMTNVDLSWYPVAMTVTNKPTVTSKSLWRQITEPKTTVEDTSTEAQLKALLAQDDLADQNPFANLSSEEPLNAIFKAGVSRFERQTMRSRSYRDESGYDLVHYNIELSDGRTSHVLVYLERTLEALENPDGEPSIQKEIPVIIVMMSSPEESEYSVFRDGALIETSQIPSTQAENLLAQRLANTIPFLSVSR